MPDLGNSEGALGASAMKCFGEARNTLPELVRRLTYVACSAVLACPKK